MGLFNGLFKLGNRKQRRSRRSENRLGTILTDLTPNEFVRDPRLDILDMYYEGNQYTHLMPWLDALKEETYVPIRERAPLVNLRFGKVLCSRVSAKLFGNSVWPEFNNEDDPNFEEYIKLINKSASLPRIMVEAGKFLCAHGSVFVRFKANMGKFHLEVYRSKWCFPEFTDTRELKKLRIQYVFVDQEDKDEKGNPKHKWFRLDLNQFEDILYNTPELKDGEEPKFDVVETASHNLGFVQGEWFKTGDDPFSPDGPSIIEDIMDFIDSMNYNISQSDQAIGYNQDPQVTFSGMDGQEIDNMIRSSEKSWNLGRQGKAELLETSMSGAQVAGEFRTDIRLHIQDISRVILLDPEKLAAHAQSGRAMEILHGPFLELIDELRTMVEGRLKNLILKMALTNLVLVKQGEPSPVTVPPGYRPDSLALTVLWHPVFRQTMDDLLKKVQVANAASSGNLISRRTGTEFLAQDFGIEDIDAEIDEIDDQPVLNPFGAF